MPDGTRGKRGGGPMTQKSVARVTKLVPRLDKARLDDTRIDEIFHALTDAGHSLEEAHDIFDAYSQTPLADGRPRGEVELGTYEPQIVES